MAALYEAGIGGILDYAAEDDVDAAAGPASRAEPHDTVVARTYDYDTEAACDRHTSIFLRSIAAAADGRGQGFAAIKVRSLLMKNQSVFVIFCNFHLCSCSALVASHYSRSLVSSRSLWGSDQLLPESFHAIPVLSVQVTIC